MSGVFDTETQLPIEPLVFYTESKCKVLHYPSVRLFLQMSCGNDMKPSVLHADFPASSTAVPQDMLRVWFDREGFVRGLFLSDYASANHVRISCKLGQITSVVFLHEESKFHSVFCDFVLGARAPTLSSIIAQLPRDSEELSNFTMQEDGWVLTAD